MRIAKGATRKVGNVRIKRALTGLAASVFIGGAAVLATAGPAQANEVQCQNYLHQKGYAVGPRVKEACRVAERVDTGMCRDLLLIAGVSRNHATTACALGAL